MNQYYINLVGLIFDIIGAILIFIYGVPSEISKTGAQYRILEQEDENEKALWKKYNLRSKIGLGLLITGFAFQFLSTWISMCK
jgi:hypothetical protein